MTKETLPKHAVIYCKTVIKSITGNNMSLVDRQDKCLTYAEKKGMEALRVFTDEGTSEPPHLRPGFGEMQEFLRKAPRPIAVIVPDVISITCKIEEVQPVFKLLKHTMNVELIDLAYISGDAMQRRMEYEALLEDTLKEFYDFLDGVETQSAHFFTQMMELEKRKEALL